MEKKKIIIGTFVALILIGAACAGTVYYYLFAPQFHPKKTVYIYIDRDDTADSIYNKVEQQGHPRSFTGFRWMAQYKKYSENIHTGRYTIRPGENVYHVFSRLYRGYQEPTNLTVGSVRTLDRLARSVGKQLMIDSAEIAGLMNDSAFQQKLGYNKETLPCLFIPETYQVYWDMSAEEFFERMQKEHQKFWNQERLDKATAIGMTPTEVCTLASIVEEETNNTPEKPMVAGLYINRLHTGRYLQGLFCIFFPVGTQVLPVYPDFSHSPAGHVKKGLLCRVAYCDTTFTEARDGGGTFFESYSGHIAFLNFQWGHLPAFQICLSQCYAAVDTF